MRYTTKASGAVPARAGDARQRVSDLLANADLDVDERVRGDALLLTSELVTNAVRHAGGLTGFTASVTRGNLCLEVSDASVRAPVMPARDLYTPGGFGWFLVNELASEVDLIRTREGKTIRVLIPLRRRRH